MTEPLMDPDIGEKWVAALESGDYEQGKLRLRQKEEFCCLGVLCDLYIWETGRGEWRPEAAGYAFHSASSTVLTVLPAEVMVWAGMSNGGHYGEMANLASDNDNGKTFVEIAKIIRREFLGQDMRDE